MHGKQLAFAVRTKLEFLPEPGDMLVTHKQLDKAPAVREWINVSYL